MNKKGRIIKNLIMIVLIIAVGVLTYFTMDYAKNNLVATTDFSEMENGGKGSGSKGQRNSNEALTEDGNATESETSNEISNEASDETSGDMQTEEPPEKPDGDNESDSSDFNPENGNGNGKNGGNMGNGGKSDSVPEKPDGDNESMTDEKLQQMQPTDSAAAPNMEEANSAELTTVYYVVFAIESLIIVALLMYLIMSKFNKYTVKETFAKASKIIIYIIITVVLTAGLTILDVYLTNEFFLTNSNSDIETFDKEMPSDEANGDNQNFENGNLANESSSELSGATVVDGEEVSLTETYTTENSDESAILVTNGGTLTLTGATVTKSGGDSSNTENSEFYGINAGILVEASSTATIKGATIYTNAKGSNAVFSTGTDSKIYISDSTITTEGSSSSRGLDATYGGYIEADNVTITTRAEVHALHLQLTKEKEQLLHQILN